MPIAYSYKRVSSKKQTRGHGIERQQDSAEEYAALHALVLDDTYHDLGVSGFRGENVKEGAALGAFLDEVKAGRIAKGSLLLVENLDRLSRDKVRIAMPVFLNIINAGIQIVTLLDNPPQVYSAEKIDADNGMSLFGSMMVMVRAHEESKSKGERVAKAWAKKREENKPMTAICPSWLQLSEDRSRYVEIPDKVAIVKRIFKMAEHMGIHSIVKTLNAEGVPHIGNARRWEAANLSRMLHSKTVIGTLVAKKGTQSPNYYPAIIEPEAFDLVQDAIARRTAKGRGRKGPVVANLLSGLIKCGNCGGGMRYSEIGPNCYVQCIGSNEGDPECKAPRLNYKPIEEDILYNLFAIEQAPIVEESAPIDPIDAYRSQRANLIEKIDRLMNDFDDAKSDYLRERAKTRADALGQELDQVEKKIANHIPEMPTAEAHERAKLLYVEHASTVERIAAGEFDSDEAALAALRDVRLRLQGSLQRVIDKIALHERIEKTYVEGEAWYWRSYVMYGKIVDFKVKSENVLAMTELTEDGGLLFEYPLPTWGLNNAMREAEYQRQDGNPEPQEIAHDITDLAQVASDNLEIARRIMAIPEAERTEEMTRLLGSLLSGKDDLKAVLNFINRQDEELTELAERRGKLGLK